MDEGRPELGAALHDGIRPVFFKTSASNEGHHDAKDADRPGRARFTHRALGRVFYALPDEAGVFYVCACISARYTIWDWKCAASTSRRRRRLPSKDFDIAASRGRLFQAIVMELDPAAEPRTDSPRFVQGHAEQSQDQRDRCLESGGGRGRSLL
jgi:hypothetical protein